jgi:hypothetical protein
MIEIVVSAFLGWLLGDVFGGIDNREHYEQ